MFIILFKYIVYNYKYIYFCKNKILKNKFIKMLKVFGVVLLIVGILCFC